MNLDNYKFFTIGNNQHGITYKNQVVVASVATKKLAVDELMYYLWLNYGLKEAERQYLDKETNSYTDKDLESLEAHLRELASQPTKV